MNVSITLSPSKADHGGGTEGEPTPERTPDSDFKSLFDVIAFCPDSQKNDKWPCP